MTYLRMGTGLLLETVSMANQAITGTHSSTDHK
jgi:hypothetical protein